MQAVVRAATIGLLAALMCGQAYACRFDQSGPMPVCRTPVTAPQERLVIIKALGRAQHTNIVVMPDDAPGPNESRPYKVDRPVHFGLFKVHIEDVGEPITLVLSNDEPLIFQIEGRIDLVQRVIVLGATSGGRESVGVTGMPPSRIEYAPVIGFDESRYTSCSKPPDACVPWQFFGEQPSSKPDEVVASGAYSFLDKNPYTHRNPVALDASDAYQYLGTRIQLRDGQLAAERITSDKVFSKLSADEYASLSPENSYFLGTNRELAELNPDTIESTLRLTKAPVLQGWFGLRQLQAEGKLLLPDDNLFGAIYDRYVNTSPEWSTGHEPPVMAILTQSNTMLPIGDLDSLRDTVFRKFPILVPEGVELSDVRGSSDICYLFQIPRDHRLACNPDELFPRQRR